MKTHAALHAVRSFSSYSLTGEPMETSIYYVGDMYMVETYCIGDEPEIEYFIRLSDAIAYAETV